MVEILRDKQAINIQKIESFCDISCRVYPHKTLNTSKGIIRDRRLYCCSDEEIKENLAKQGVTNVRRILIRKNNEQVKSNTFILTFNNPSRPEKVNIFFERITVSPYIPNPLRCFNCQKFGHHENNCKNLLTCVNCAGLGDHHEGSCNKPVKCANCGAPHPANSNKCPVWKKEKEVTRIKFTNNISYPEARKLVENVPAQTYSVIVQSSNKIMKDAETQTSDACTQTPESSVVQTVSVTAADKPSASAVKPSASAVKPSASADKPSAPAVKPAAPAGKPAASAGKSNAGTPAPNGKNVAKAKSRSAGQQRNTAARTGQAVAQAKQGLDPIKTGNKFDALRDGAHEGMDCESSPSAHGSRNSHPTHSPIRPPTK